MLFKAPHYPASSRAQAGQLSWRNKQPRRKVRWLRTRRIAPTIPKDPKSISSKAATTRSHSPDRVLLLISIRESTISRHDSSGPVTFGRIVVCCSIVFKWIRRNKNGCWRKRRDCISWNSMSCRVRSTWTNTNKRRRSRSRNFITSYNSWKTSPNRCLVLRWRRRRRSPRRPFIFTIA
jgi:hypothetical protein